MSRKVIIETLTIRLPNGWNGDRVHLARGIAQQLQQQATDLSSSKQLNFDARGHFGGATNRVNNALADQITALRKNKGGRKP